MKTGEPVTESWPPETLKLINAELADATTEERQYWYEQLKRVDPAVIPQILQARKLTTQVVDQQQRESGGKDWRQDPPSEAGAVVQASAAEFPGEKRDLNSALLQSDGLSMRQPMVQQGYDDARPPDAGKQYAVQRVPDGKSSPAGTTPTLPLSPVTPPSMFPNPAAARNALSKLIPSNPRGGNAPVVSANTGTAVSLLPPSYADRDPVWQSRLDPLISALEADIAQLHPGNSEESQSAYLQRHVYLRLLYLMAHHPERAMTAIPGVDAADQEFWQQTLWAMANYFDHEHIPQAKDRAGQAAVQLTAATLRLREKADLEIRNLAFCQEIAYFGNFTRFPRDEFRPGDSTLLYAEMENFKSELTVDGQYRTLLRSTIEILSPSGELRWQKEFKAEEDLCVNYRRDYFHNYQFTIPERLPLGPHILKLTIFDELSGKMVSQSLNFVVR